MLEGSPPDSSSAGAPASDERAGATFPPPSSDGSSSDGASLAPDEITEMPSADVGRVPPPRITATGVGLTAAGWLLLAVLYSVLLTRAENVPFVGALLGQLLESLLLGVASLPVWVLTVRKMDAVSGVYTALAHVVIAPFFAWGTLEAYLWLMHGIAGPAIASQIADQYQWIFVSHLTLYVIEFAVFHLFRSMERLRWRERQAAEYASLARERELAALKAQINPHFLFNTFHSISATVPAAPQKARQMISDLADLFRYVLDSTDRETVPLQEEIRFVRSYLDLEAHRFSDRLDVCYDIEPSEEALDVDVPPMILQPLVENALKHGIAPSEDGGTISLSVNRDDDALRIAVTDTGVGLGGDASRPEEGVGLSNTSKRLTHTFGPDAALHTEPVSPHGFCVWFRIPTR